VNIRGLDRNVLVEIGLVLVDLRLGGSNLVGPRRELAYSFLRSQRGGARVQLTRHGFCLLIVLARADALGEELGLPLELDLRLGERRVVLATLGAHHVLLLLALALELVLVARLCLGQSGFGAGDLGLGHDRIDHEQPVAFFDLAAAIDRTFDQPAGNRRRDQAGLAFDIAEITAILVAEAERGHERRAPVETRRGERGSHEDRDDAFHDGLRACSIRSA